MSENSGIRLLRYYFRKLKSFLFSKDILSFLFFLFLSACFWFFHALDKERETVITIPIHYVGIPKDVAIKNNPPSEISLSVKEKGLKLFTNYSNGNQTPLNIDLKGMLNQKGVILISSNLLKTKISQYLLPTTTILEIKTDSFYIKYDKLYEATIPIKLESKVELASQYMLSQKISLKPAYIKVFGPKSIIDTLKFIRTEFFEIKSLNDTTTYTCKLQSIKNVKFSTLTTNATFFVEHFTEKRVQIPVSTINCPSHFLLKTFPAYVSVTYFVGLSNFNDDNQKDIQVYLDYNDIKPNAKNRQKLKIKNNSPHISNIRITPEEAEFLLEEI